MGSNDLEDLGDVSEKVDVLTVDLMSLLDVHPDNPDQWSEAQDDLKQRLEEACREFLEDQRKSLSERP